MPNVPQAARKCRETVNTPSKSKAVDVGNPLGTYDTNTVRDRVRQWQAQGGGVVTAPDVYLEGAQEKDIDVQSVQDISSPEQKVCKSFATKDVSPEGKSSDTPRSRKGRQRKKPSGGEEDERDRSKSAPARRVISDAHWRRDRSPPKNKSSPKASKGTTSPRVSRYTDNDGIRVTPMPAEKEARASTRHEELEERRKSDTWTTKDNTTSTKGRSPGKDPSILANGSNSNTVQIEGGSIPCETYTRSLNSSAKRGTRPTRARSPRMDSTPDASIIQTDDNIAQTDQRSEKTLLSTYGSISGQKESRRSPKGNILSQVFEQSRQAFAKPQPTPLEPSRLPSVESWLNTTPDPFVDGERPPLENAAPRVDRGETSSPTKETVPVGDPNKIWDTIESKDRARSGVRASRRRKRIPSSTIFTDNPFPANFDSGSSLHTSPAGSTSASKLVDLVDDASQSPSAPTSKGARKSVSALKRTPRNEIHCDGQPEGDAASTLSSNPTVSSIEASDHPALLRGAGLKRRPFLSTGRHRLSTIASVDTLQSKTQLSEVVTDLKTTESRLPSKFDDAEACEVESGDQFDPDSLKSDQSRLTKHADLISVLSMQDTGNKSIRSARSIRTNRSRLATATAGDLMAELASDEKKYMRELRTLVDGVIPVLLTCVLSKSDSSVAAGLFSPNYNGEADASFTKPIIDMGIALERLKSLHRRIPMQDVKSLLTWAQGAQRVYMEYLRSWRMGFQDVVVNLAPANEHRTAQDSKPPSEAGGLDEGLPINKDGDVVDGDGERVDVAFLLKRPLVRLKYLAKTLKGINIVSPSAESESLATKYQNLVTMARNRSNEERARLEDEAAANIDTTRARDPRTLALMTGVSIDRTRRVKARDHFNLALLHSSGQRVDCRVELLLRDEASEIAGSGDLLVCEVDSTGKWLLFPPIQFGRVSARNGDSEGEIVVMIRGLSGTGIEWHELLSLRSEDEQASFEWVQMLGLTPIPPTISRIQSFLTKHRRKGSTPNHALMLEAPTNTSSPTKSRTPSPREIEIPIGEQATKATKAWVGSKSEEIDVVPLRPEAYHTPIKPPSNFRDMSSENVGRSPHTYVDSVNDLRSLPSQSSEKPPLEQESFKRPRSFKEALGLSGTSNVSLGLKRTRAQKLPGSQSSPSSPRSPRGVRSGTTSPRSSRRSLLDVEEASRELPVEARDDRDQQRIVEEGPRSSKERKAGKNKENRSDYHRATSSVPSLDLPTIPKIRKESPPTTPVDEPQEEPQWLSPPESKLAPSSFRKVAKQAGSPNKKSENSSPSSPDHRYPVKPQPTLPKTPVLSANLTRASRRRSSSPLKHEYEPSSASDSSESEASTVEHNEASSVSSSDDEELELGDIPGPLRPLRVVSKTPRASVQDSVSSLPSDTLRPSESASQAPYKKVPPQPAKASKTIASIFSWSDRGSWGSLHPDECSIIITPGLIEAYEMTAAHSASVPLSAPAPVEDIDAFSEMASNINGSEEMPKDDRPLVALELTPLVPLRRGTAIDISIRSPPTPSSQITSGNNIMFRSRNPEECEALYALINHARIHNPTYIALQNARGPFDAPNDLERQASTRAGGSRMSSWFGGVGRSPSYRASSAPTPSISPSESSIGSMSSAFSALKRFGIGKGGGMFNIARSTISSREGSRANSIYTSSDNSSGSGASSPLPPGIQGDPHGQIGLSNTKIRLYFRETQTKWRDMGSARLTIMRPSALELPSGTSASGDSVARPSSARQVASEKRIVVRGENQRGDPS